MKAKKLFLIFFPKKNCLYKYLLTFLNGIANTYINNTVVLNDGRCGEIVMNNASILSRPIIRIANEFVDLSVNKQLKIVNIL